MILQDLPVPNVLSPHSSWQHTANAIYNAAVKCVSPTLPSLNSSSIKLSQNPFDISLAILQDLVHGSMPMRNLDIIMQVNQILCSLQIQVFFAAFVCLLQRSRFLLHGIHG
jgi:hypothetical protein